MMIYSCQQLSAMAASFVTLASLLAPVSADNPIIQTRYTADPAPMLHDGRVYLFTSHDEDRGRQWFDMFDWRLYSSADMVNWLDHGSPLSLVEFEWAESDAWAGHAVERNGKFYWYVPMSQIGGERAIGVAVADNVTGPYVDALGEPLLADNEIDPHCFIDPLDGQAYLYWGNPGLSYVKLNEDMVSFEGEPISVNLTAETFGPRRDADSDRESSYEEGPWLYEHEGLYYLLYAANCCPEDVRYSTGPTATGPWTYRGLIMATQGRAFTNHPGVIHYMGNSYFFYHNGALPGGGGFRRSVAVEQFLYNPDGSITNMVMTDRGAPQIRPIDPYVRQEAELIAWSEGLSTESTSDEGGGINVNGIHSRDSLKVAGVDFGTFSSSPSPPVVSNSSSPSTSASEGGAPRTFLARVSSGVEGGRIEVRLSNWERGTLLSDCEVPGTGGFDEWITVECEIDPEAVGAASGVHDLWFGFYGVVVPGWGQDTEDKEDLDGHFKFNWWQFVRD